MDEENEAKSTFGNINKLFENKKYLDAAKLIQPDMQPFSEDEFLLGSRLASHLGNERLCNYLVVKGNEKYPDNELLQLYKFLWRISVKGIFESYIQSRDFLKRDYKENDVNIYYLCTAAILSAELHFFDEAENILDIADEIEYSTTWREQIRLFVNDKRDNWENAKHLINLLLDKYNGEILNYPRLFSIIAQHLWKYDNKSRALELLEELENGNTQYFLPHQLQAHYYLEQNDYKRSAEKIDLLESKFQPYYDRNYRQSISALKLKHYQQSGNRSAMLNVLPQLRGKYYRIVENNVKSAPENARRIILNLPLVAQKENTCVPASLASIAAYFGINLDQDNLAEKVCANGTPHHKIFAWAKANNWIHRPFEFSFEDANKLLSAGFPFVLYTEGVDYKHCQAVAGIDYVTGELLIREPGISIIQEILAKEMLKEQSLNGPMCVVFAPPEKNEKLVEIQLHGEEDYCRLVEIEALLYEHKISEAAKLSDEIDEAHPAFLQARFLLAHFRMAAGEKVKLLKKSYEENRDNEIARWRYVSSLNFNEHAIERLNILREICDSVKTPHPIFFQEFANTLTLDSRELKKAEKIANRAVRLMPFSGICYYVLGFILSFDAGRIQKAFLAYKAASMLDCYNEHFYQEWFNFARDNRLEKIVIAEMEKRVDKLGDKTPFPAITLADAYFILNRQDDALKLLLKQHERFDETGEAMINYIRLFSNVNYEKAVSIFENLKISVSSTIFRMTKIELLLNRGQWHQALEILEAELYEFPDNKSAFTLYIELKFREDDSEEFYEKILNEHRTETNVERLSVIAQVVKNRYPDVFFKAAERILEIDPYNSFYMRELAFYYLDNKDINKAEEYCDKSAEIAGIAPQTHCLIGDIALMRNDYQTARSEYLKALSIDINYQYVYHQLTLCAPESEEDKIALINEIKGLIKLHPIGDAYVAGIIHLTETILSKEYIKQILLDIKKERPDISQLWIELFDYYDSKIPDEMIEEAIKMFPNDKYFVYIKAVKLATQGAVLQAINLIDEILESRPLFAQARCYKAYLYTMTHDYEAAEKEYRKAMEFIPDNSNVVVAFAEFLISVERIKEALELLDENIKRSPNSIFSMTVKLDLLLKIGNSKEAAELADNLVEKFPWEISAHITAVDVKLAIGDMKEALNALNKAKTLAPRNKDVYLKHIMILERQHKLKEAMEVAEEAADICKNTELFMYQTAIILRKMGNKKRAYTVLQEIIKKTGDKYSYNNVLADWYFEDGKISKAETHAKKLFEKFPNIPECGIRYAEFFEMKNQSTADREKALNIYHHILEKHPNYAPALCGVFDSMTRYGRDYKNAVKVLEVAVDANPALKTPYVIFRLAFGSCMAYWTMKRMKQYLWELVNMEVYDELNLYVILWEKLPFNKAIKYMKAIWKILKQKYSSYLAKDIASIILQLEYNQQSVILANIGIGVTAICKLAMKQNPPDIFLLEFVLAKKRVSFFEFDFKWFIKKHLDFFKQNPETWQAMGIFYSNAMKNKECVEWTENWREQPYIDFYFACARLNALHDLERYNEAAAMVFDCLNNIPHDAASLAFAAEGYYLFALQEDWQACRTLNEMFNFRNDFDKITDREKNFFILGEAMYKCVNNPTEKNLKDAHQLLKIWPTVATNFKPFKTAKKKYKKWLEMMVDG